ncbi:MAG: NADP oxidoreductase [Candidatus Omnitrophica bacterium]|nr:NADP oxidoreductase [Candidatus Omnitrophota bacterium]
MSKKKIATVWLGGCSGCHMSILDIDERILDVAKLADIVKCPLVDGKEMPEVDVTLVEGSITSDEHLHEIRLIRERSKIVISLGDCAITTNITGMRNYYTKEQALDQAYVHAPSNDGKGQMPLHPQLLKLNDRVIPLHEAVNIDYYIPGCPPSADTIFYVLFELLNGRVPNLDQERKLKYG